MDWYDVIEMGEKMDNEKEETKIVEASSSSPISLVDEFFDLSKDMVSIPIKSRAPKYFRCICSPGKICDGEPKDTGKLFWEYTVDETQLRWEREKKQARKQRIQYYKDEIKNITFILKKIKANVRN
jgi:hypothetical protein